MATTVRLPEELDNEMKELARREHTSVHALLVKAAEEYAARRNKRAQISQAADWIKRDYADALRRLGE